MVKMNYIICYDISEDDIRTSVSDACKNIGLERIQYSVFTGKLSKSELKSLGIQIKKILTNCSGQVLILPSCSSCMKKKIALSSSIDEEEENSTPPDPMEEKEVIVF